MTPMAWRAVDHVMLRLDALEPLHGFFADVLGLPVTWPARNESFASYSWIGLGNTHLELWAATSNSDLPAETRLPLLHGFALTPLCLETSMATLRQVGITCNSPRTWHSPTADGVERVNFTNAVIPDLCGPACCVFFCDWSDDAPIAPWSAAGLPRREWDKAVHCNAKENLLGILGLSDIVLASPDPRRAAATWRKAGLQWDEGALLLTQDIRLRIVEGPVLCVESLALRVRDLARTRSLLRQHGRLMPTTDDEVWMKAPEMAGLHLRFLQ